MNTMQSELDETYPALRIQLLGVNQRGQEPGNANATDGRDIPWLQDVDENQNSAGDVADDLWDVAYRDVVILDGENVQVGVFNLSANDLGEPEHYAALREMLVDAAMLSQLPWMNPADPLDVDDNGNVVPLDVLLLVNQLAAQGSHELPPPTEAELSQPYYDTNGDGNLTPLDPLQIINFLNSDQNQAEGESPSAEGQPTAQADLQASADPTAAPHSVETDDDGAELNSRRSEEAVVDEEQDSRESHRRDSDETLGLDYFRLPISATKESSSGN